MFEREQPDRSRGFGFVEFSTSEEMEEAKKGLNGTPHFVLVFGLCQTDRYRLFLPRPRAVHPPPPPLSPPTRIVARYPGSVWMERVLAAKDADEHRAQRGGGGGDSRPLIGGGGGGGGGPQGGLIQPGSDFCFFCRGSGHWARECPMKVRGAAPAALPGRVRK